MVVACNGAKGKIMGGVMKKLELCFSEINWGDDEAKNDERLDTYFVEFPEFDRILVGEKRFVIGRKGTGKTAILQKIRSDSADDATKLYKNISLRDFPLNDFKAMGDRSYQNKSKYISAWKFVLLTELASLIIEDQSFAFNEEVTRLKSFIDLNFPEGISVPSIITTLQKRHQKLTWSPLSSLNLNVGKEKEVQSTGEVHFHKIVQELERVLLSFSGESTYYLLIDELDEGYNSRNDNLNLVILALLRAADEIFGRFKTQSGIECIPIVVLRSDIFEHLEDNDLNKLDDYILRLNWTTDEKSPWSLKMIAEKRIAALVQEKYPDLDLSFDDYWGLIADEGSVVHGLWQNICILTFTRPRDIVKLLKYCKTKMHGNERLNFRHVTEAIGDYSNWFYNEFRDEVQSFFPVWKESLNCIASIAKGRETVSELMSELIRHPAIKEWCDNNQKQPEDIINILFNYSVIGCINANGRWLFKYTDVDLEFMTTYPYYCVHFGLCKKLRIERSYYSTNRVNIIKQYS